MLEIFFDQYGVYLLALLGGLTVFLFWRAVVRQRQRQRILAESHDRVRATFAQAADQGQLIDLTAPQWDDEEMYLGQGRYLGGHNEGMLLELWVRPGSAVLNHENVNGYFRLKHSGPTSHYDFASSMYEYSRDGDRVEVIVPWPAELGHGKRRYYPAPTSNTTLEPTLRLWRACDGDDALGPQGWELVPQRAVLVTDIRPDGVRLGVESAQSALLPEGTLVLCRLSLPYADAVPLELILAGTVKTLLPQPDLSHDVLDVTWLRWALPAEMTEIQWHRLSQDQVVPLLHNWVGLRQLQ